MDKPKFFSTHGHLMLCQNTNCVQRGADHLHRVLTVALEREHLMYYKKGGTLRYTASGCLGACSSGPVLACYRQRDGQLEQGWYYGATLPVALEVARAVHNERDLPLERRFDVEEVEEADIRRRTTEKDTV